MCCRDIGFLTCVFLAVVTAADCTDPDSITEYDPEVTVFHLRTDSSGPATVESKQGVDATAAFDLQPPAETSAPAPVPPPAPAAGRATPTIRLAPPPAPTAGRATPTSRLRSDRTGYGWVHSSAEPPSLPCRTHPRDTVDVSLLRSLSDEEKSRMLLEAAKRGAVEELQALLAAGADAAARGESEMAVLHWAATRGCEQAVRELLWAGAEVDARDEWRNTPLLLATLHGHTAVVQLLVAAAADANVRNQWGSTPLHWAAYRGDAGAAAALLAAGAEKAARNHGGETPLDYARHYNRLHLVDMLS